MTPGAARSSYETLESEQGWSWEIAKQVSEMKGEQSLDKIEQTCSVAAVLPLALHLDFLGAPF